MARFDRPAEILATSRVRHDTLLMVSTSVHSEALSHWAGWAVRLQLGKAVQREAGVTEALGISNRDAVSRPKKAHAALAGNICGSLPSWLGALDLIRNCKAMSEAAVAPLGKLYKEWNLRLSPLCDPLNVLFFLHRQLSSSREEVYSDWLQWVLLQVADTGLIGRMLASENPERFANSHEAILVEREVPVEEGNIGHTGRLDVVIKRGAAWLAVIEVKTRAYTESDLGKHEGYLGSGSSSETEFIFLAVKEPDPKLKRFRFLSWADVCITLRAIAPRLMLDPEGILRTALILAFIGAVEKNLLGFVWPVTSLTPIGKVPLMVDHLTKAAQAEGA